MFVKSSKIKFNENSSYGSRIGPCGLGDITKLIVTYHILEYA